MSSRPENLPKAPAWRRRWDQTVPIAGTPGADYLAGRNISVEIANAADVRYLERWEHWSRTPDEEWILAGTSRRVVFPIRDQAGELVGIQGRAIDPEYFGEKIITNGSAGVFLATQDGLACERVAVAEAPCDALSLVVLGIAALSTQGTSWPAWLPRTLAFKTVLLAQDADEAGDHAAALLTAELGQWGARPERWRPQAKDWNEDLRAVAVEEVPAGTGPGPDWKPWLDPVEAAKRVWYPGTCRWCGRPMHDQDYVCWRPERQDTAAGAVG